MNLTAPFRGCRYSILKNAFDGDILLSGEFVRLKEENCEYLECEKKWVFALLIFVGGYFGGHALFGALIPLMALFADLLYADLNTEKGRIGEKPHGH